MCDEPFLCADATELPNHPALRRALKLRDASGLQLFPGNHGFSVSGDY